MSSFNAATVLPLLGGEEEAPKPSLQKKIIKKLTKNNLQKLEGGFEPVANARPTETDVMDQICFMQIKVDLQLAIPKYNQGGVNYLPSKSDHDENDVNNYVRAEGYVEDGAGNWRQR